MAPATTTTPPTTPTLTPRELETLHYITSGHTYQQTARHMGLSPHTIDTYLRRIRTKLHTNTTAQLTRHAITLGL
ncbi:helix-turn-helix transcriptional regulator [Streptomyces sp. LHD-70]|uniref:response regulator transcription factor n=1 Tax=Streptomyces sp. LHD-70 TaxID=3072140 RepID=UPI0028100B0A|nr:helix-turn-helix transcriptional regulator [Streptomyces sp. LHD-70]MDQ8708351.1 helix-turn-helix transcriptional regulator [Streptomyces sp. LHD-70]